MNENIEKIAKDLNLLDQEGKFFHPTLEVFAEMIIRACADRIDNLTFCDNDGDLILNCDCVKTELMEHFGIEEYYEETCPRCGAPDGGTSCGLPDCGLISE